MAEASRNASNMKLLPGANSAKRIWTDYSLRKFILYAISPLHWMSLLTLKLRAKEEKRVFFGCVNQWQNASAPRADGLCFIFHPWLQANNNASVVRRNEIVADSESPDPEIRMRLDRLGWALQMAIHDQNDAWQAVGKWLEERWKCGLACRGSYSISERISNLILLWNIQEPEPSLSSDVLGMMERDAEYLLGHLEYYGEYATNNHILNNARALILAGSFQKNQKFYDAGCWLLETQLSKHVSSDGVVREASTHYQWVITRWIMEVECVFHSLDQVRFQQLRPLLKSMLDVCGAMQLGKGKKAYLPLIGDISPDFPPRLYGGMTELGHALVGDTEQETRAPLTTDGLWSRFFIGRNKPIPERWQAADGSWVRLANNKWSLIAHADMHPDDSRATHGHHDLFSFELAFDGVPIIVDPGRKNYLAGRDHEEAGILEEWHNTLLVNNKRTGFVPRGYMPASWLQNIRTCPCVAVADQCLEIRLDSPREVPGIFSIQRILNLSDEKIVKISNWVIRNNAHPADVKLVMYVMGIASLEDDELKLGIGALEFMIRWRGLSAPVLRDAIRYVGYGISEPCTRLEWVAVAADREWESTIEIVTLEKEE